ncbi:alpha-L-arabinofuranosidase [candidate division KSB1 bacterium]|nr:alpha-L-arabinofuranosidase [candidate division KSB1 bacterium]
MSSKINRRNFLKNSALMTAGSLFLKDKAGLSFPKIKMNEDSRNSIIIDPTLRFEISPYLYMQFMEPLGTTDASVEAGWDYEKDDWREDLIKAVTDLAPDVVRWGGNFIRFYKWREGVGPVKDRPWMYNYAWGGKESNRVGTREFSDFCRRVGAEPLMCVNFMSDGRKRYWNTVHGENRSGDATEAADWVSYANDPDNKERRNHGAKNPYNIKLWQIGNETSYITDGFKLNEAIKHTIEFAKAMRERDPSIQLIGWGDDFRHNGDFWAGDMISRAGEHLNYIAIHMMGMVPVRKKSVLRGFEYQKDPAQAWDELLEISDVAAQRLEAAKEIVNAQKSDIGIALTEGHLSIDPHNSNPILQEWLSAVYHARTLNNYQRNGDKVKICTGADFCGTRWTVNAVRMPVPRGDSFLLPVATIMRLFKKYNGKNSVDVTSFPSDLDIVASRTENKMYLHVLNLNYRESVTSPFQINGMKVKGGKVYEIAPDEPRAYVDRNNCDTFVPKEKALNVNRWTFPPRSVSVVELNLET